MQGLRTQRVPEKKLEATEEFLKALLATYEQDDEDLLILRGAGILLIIGKDDVSEERIHAWKQSVKQWNKKKFAKGKLAVRFLDKGPYAIKMIPGLRAEERMMIAQRFQLSDKLIGYLAALQTEVCFLIEFDMEEFEGAEGKRAKDNLRRLAFRIMQKLPGASCQENSEGTGILIASEGVGIRFE